MAYTKYSLTPADNNAAPPNGAPEGMLPSAVNDTMRDMMSQIRDVGDGIRGGTYTMTAPVITGGSITGVALSGNTLTNPVITGGSINNTPIGATTASTGRFSDLTDTGLTSGRVIYASTGGNLVDDADFTFNGTTVTMANDASISGLTVGKGGGSVATNTAFGAQAFNATATGGGNTGVGYQADASITSGTSNSAFGQFALTSNSTGSSNTGIGTQALNSNTTASNNTAVGYQAGYSNTTGSLITAIGRGALYTNTTGSNSVAVGYNALFTNNGDSNNAFGLQSLNVNTTGTQNCSFGTQTLFLNTTGSNNTAYGNAALISNTTASNNTAVGYQAGYSNTTGTYNTYVGRGAGYSTTTGSGNTFIGVASLTGEGAGYQVTTGSDNTIIGGYNGNQGGLDIRTASNYIVLSDGDGNPRGIFDGSGFFLMGVAAAYNGTAKVQLQNTAGGTCLTVNTTSTSTEYPIGIYNPNGLVGSITTNGSSTAYNTSSDYRLKENIAPMTGALGVVQQLKPVTYDWKAGGSSQGFIAHELQAVVPDCVTGEKDAVDAEGKPVYQGIDTSFLVATLTAAIQELKAEFDAYKATHP
jgi:trimeric autotransporter adhesin